MPKVSIFKNIWEPKDPDTVELMSYLEDIRDGKWEDLVTECRKINDKEKRDLFKNKMPTTCLSGLFSYRSDSSLVTHSGFIGLDWDSDGEDLNRVRRILENDKYVFACWMSSSGRGLHFLMKIDPAKHRESFDGISEYLYSTYEIILDQNSSESKPYVVSFDPNMYIDLEDKTPIFKKYIKEKEIKKIVNFVHTPSDFQEVINQVVSRRIDLTGVYKEWVKIGHAFACTFGEDGKEYYHMISQFHPKYNTRRTDKQWKYCMRQTGQKKVNISTFYFLAKAAGVSIITETTKTIIRTTKNGKAAGLKKEQIAENLARVNNIYNAEKVIDTIFESDENESEEESILDMLEMFISSNYNLEMNEVTGYIEENGVPLTENNLNTIFVAAKKLMPKLDFNLMLRLLKSDFVKVYNPFFRFFESDGIPVILSAIPEKHEREKKWDSPLIDKLAETIKNDNPSFTLFFVRKWIVSVISSAHKVHSPLLLCLLGGQNTGKTEWFRRLLPKELQSYYAESKLDKEKDDEILMCENLIIMDDELGGKSKSDNLKLKNLTSKQWFSLRRPYGSQNEKILRLAVLCGTSNLKSVLSDPTGNRRIIPIDVEDIDKVLYNSIDKKELFFEAFRLYKQGFDWRITQDDIQFLNKDSLQYEIVIPERELISKYFEPVEDEDKSHRFSTTDIKVEIEKLTNQRLSTMNIGRELETLGYIKKSTRLNAYQTPKLWCAKRINRASQEQNYF